MRHAAAALATASVLAITLLSGCASDNKAETTEIGDSTVTIKEVTGQWLENGEDGVALIQHGEEITGLELVLGGSGTKECAPQISTASISGPDLVVTLADDLDDTACTMDLVPYAWEIGVKDPAGIKSVTVDGGEYRETRVFNSEEFTIGSDD